MNKRHYEHTLPNIRGSLSNTYFYVHLNIARYVFSRSKYFEHPGKRLALAGGGLTLRSREASQTYGVCAMKRRLMPSNR